MSVKDAHSYLGDLDDEDAREESYESTVKYLNKRIILIKLNCLFFNRHFSSSPISNTSLLALLSQLENHSRRNSTLTNPSLLPS